MDKARNFQHHEHVALMAQVIPLYYSNDIAGFQSLKIPSFISTPTPSTQSGSSYKWADCQRDAITPQAAWSDKVADYLFKRKSGPCMNWSSLALTAFMMWTMSHGLGSDGARRFLQRNWSPSQLMHLSPELLPALLRTLFFWKRQLFQLCVALSGRGIALRTQCFSLSQGICPVSKGQTEEGWQQIEAMHIFDVLGLLDRLPIIKNTLINL